MRVAIGFRTVRVIDYIIGYLGLSSLILGALEVRGTLEGSNELAVWLIAAVLVPIILGVIAAYVDTKAREFSYGTLIVATIFVDISALIRYRLPVKWLTDNVAFLVGMNVAAMIAACAAAWLVRRLMNAGQPVS